MICLPSTAALPSHPPPPQFLLPPLRAPFRLGARRRPCGRGAGRRPALPSPPFPSPGLATGPPAPAGTPPRRAGGHTWAGPAASSSPSPAPPCRAVPLASQSAQYLLSSSRSSLARMAWCCSFCFCAFSRQERVAMAAAVAMAMAAAAVLGRARHRSGRAAPALAQPREPAAASADFLNRNYLRPQTPPPHSSLVGPSIRSPPFWPRARERAHAHSVRV